MIEELQRKSRPKSAVAVALAHLFLGLVWLWITFVFYQQYGAEQLLHRGGIWTTMFFVMYFSLVPSLWFGASTRLRGVVIWALVLLFAIAMSMLEAFSFAISDALIWIAPNIGIIYCLSRRDARSFYWSKDSSKTPQ